MFDRFAKTALALLLAGSAAGTGGAATLLEQAPAGTGGVISTGARPSYDDFRLTSAAAITGVTWWASSFANISGDFRISFTGVTANGYADVAHPLYTATINAVVGQTIGNFIQYDVQLPTAALLPGGTNLYLSIADVRPGAFYYWASAASSPSPGALPHGLMLTYNSPTPTVQGLDAAWALNAGPVPEPAAWALMTIGFGLTGATLRHRRKVMVTSLR